MKKDYLLAKWLSGEITPQELEELKKLEDLPAYEKIIEKTALLQVPPFNNKEQLQQLKDRLSKQTKVVKLNPWKYAAGIAATIAVLISLYIFIPNNTKIVTEYAQKKEFNLPDASHVTLNSGSQIVYNERKWDKKREVNLNGEAFFEVAKGKKFDVVTTAGSISVLGTKFNVKNRENYFEVSCYEGKVQVAFKDTVAILTHGKAFRVINNKIVNVDDSDDSVPQWTQNISKFKSIPYKLVLKEIERIFDIKVEAKNVDLNYHFTGEFNHNDKKAALTTITQPLNLEFEIIDDKNATIHANNGN